MKIKVNALFLLALIIAGAGLFMFFLLFLKGEELLPKDYVFTSKDGKIETYSDITPENFKELFEVKEILKASVTPYMITINRMDEVMMKTFISPLYPGEFLTSHHVVDPVLVPHENELAYPIPNTWWEVIDWTGRIGDIGEIWLTPSETLRKWYEQQQNAAHIDGSVTASTEDANTASIRAQAEQGKTYAVVPDRPDRPLLKPIYEDVRVRYVFDSSNKQIRNSEGVGDRSEGTGRPENVKLYLTAEKYADLKRAVEEGYKLILAVDNGGEFR